MVPVQHCGRPLPIGPGRVLCARGKRERLREDGVSIKAGKDAAGWAFLVLLAASLLAMVTHEAHQPRAMGSADVREVGSQVVVGPHGGERTIPEKIIVDGETFRVVE